MASLSNPLDVRSIRLSNDAINHSGLKDNPHDVTKAQVGLANVDNTSDASKPISTDTQGALDTLQLDVNDKLDGNGVSGSFTYVSTVDFTLETVTTITVTYVDGQITSVV